jgi:hypothetical protein
MTRPRKDKVMARGNNVCFPCRASQKGWGSCPRCGGPMMDVGRKTEVPKRHQIRRWRELEARFVGKPHWTDHYRDKPVIDERHRYHLYGEWPALGRYVRKGEKARYRDANGSALFHEDQTEAFEPKPSSRRPYCPDPNLRYEHEDSQQTLTPFDLGYDGDGR